jgi:hypothetical protein
MACMRPPTVGILFSILYIVHELITSCMGKKEWDIKKFLKGNKVLNAMSQSISVKSDEDTRRWISSA